MKRNIIFGLLMISCIVLFAQTTRTYTMTFNREDFSIVNTKYGSMIESNKHDLRLEEDTLKPAIPYMIINLLMPDMQIFSDYSFCVTSGNIENNIKLCPNPKVLSTNSLPQGNDTVSSYPMINYPFKIEYVKTRIIDGFHFATFKVFPISYKPLDSEIIWASKIELSITTLSTDFTEAQEYKHKGFMNDLLKDILFNPEMIDSCFSPSPRISMNENIDYLIITSEDLCSYFQPLIDWKTTKGIRSETISIDSIYAKYEGNTAQLKIKNCIKHYRNNHNTKYILLGGDDNIIPVQGCYARVNSTIDETIPTDLFYACLDEPFDWNLNGDSFIGHENDSVDVDADVYITRVPIQTNSDISAFLEKVLNYEKYPPTSNHMNKMLLAGVKLRDDFAGISDSEARSRIMYENYVEPYWRNGTATRFYDTGTDLEGYKLYDVTAEHLQEQLSSEYGYHFVHMKTHGEPQHWTMETGYFYTSNDALELYNPHQFIITTTSCNTNAFDANSDPCLSEAFIRNQESGVIAYLGSSRSGWFTVGTTKFGASLLLNSFFYEYLFTENETNFGKLVCNAKTKLTDQSVNAIKWIQYSVNPIGDPEMPIYTDIPQNFDLPIYNWNGTTLQVTTNIDSCTITITDKETKGNTYLQTYKNVQQANFIGLEEGDYTLCITKHNYIPYLTTIKSQVDYIQREHINDNRVYTGNYIRIGRNVTTEIPTGDVSIQSGASVTISASDVTIQNGFFFKEGATLKINE